MLRDRRAAGRRFRGVWVVILASVVTALSACTVAAGGGVAAVLVGVAALTSHCYDYLDVTVLDAQGRKTCTATVTASRQKSSEQFELESCYYAPLSDGRWTLRAELPGGGAAESVVDVDHRDDCTRHVQSVELTLRGAETAPRAATPAVSANSAPPVPLASSAPPEPPVPPVIPSAAPSAAPTEGAAAGAPNSGAPAAAGAPPSVGVFPNQSDSSH